MLNILLSFRNLQSTIITSLSLSFTLDFKIYSLPECTQIKVLLHVLLIRSDVLRCYESFTVYTQEVGRAGRDGSKAQAVLFYNATDLAQKHVEDSLKQFCRNSETCRREFLSGYFDSHLSSLDSDCCDICGHGSSETLICKEEVKIPTLIQRQHMSDILSTYSSIDDTGSCQTTLDEQIINLISDTFEYVNTVEKIAKYYKQHDRGAESIYAIRKFVLSM